ncbi:AMIN domain-containing protein [Scytonema sp. UIC 10036]|uniref:AMIN domain-containing protein n=1 Tax=Scytonema sp. UIC 10036 TaxID=2304196 RepID=UPI00137C608A|nr:AMIN domain-containing protein [Scytonema sp. UIC 10036]
MTANSEKLQVSPKTEGKLYIADIPNAKLQLTSGESFRQEKPHSGIALVTVTNVDASTLRVTVVGNGTKLRHNPYPTWFPAWRLGTHAGRLRLLGLD